VDLTKVAIARRIVLLAAVDTSTLAVDVLLKVAELARRCDGEVVVLHVMQSEDGESIAQLQQQTNQLLADIRYQFVTVAGVVSEEIVSVAREYGVAEIVMGKRGHRLWDNVLVGSVSQAVLEKSLIPVVVVEKRKI
ncbi:MAG: universal stress protein, partial [Okeania sp. SIO2H7]|nr:universal stress protein [Okeania sp. SIO2H7]